MRKAVNHSIHPVRCLLCFCLLSFFSFHSSAYAAAAAHFDTVQKIFIGYYQRPADPAGLIYWAERLEASGGNPTTIIEGFANSKESQDLYGVIDNSNISTVVNNIYLALFNRNADEVGRNYYADGFNTGRFTAATIMLNILNGASHEDLLSVNHKLAAAKLFTETIDPDLDGSNFQATYTGDGDILAARNFLTLYATSLKVPVRTETTAYVRSHIADIGDGILTAVPTPRFVDKGNGTVLDTVSNLIWLKDANCFGMQEWTSAMEKADTLASGQCGLSDGSNARDWHLPYVQELRLVADAGYRFAELNLAGFSNVQADFYWSSNTSDCALNAYDVNLRDGLMYNDAKLSYLYVWPVRAGR